MKERIIFLALAAALLLGAFALAPRLEAREAPEEIRLAVATDPHYLADELTDFGECYMRVVTDADGKAMPRITELMRAFASEIAREGPDALIITGDLTFNGERLSHERLAEKLGGIEARGRARLRHPRQPRPRKPGRGALRGRRLRARGQRHGGGIRGDILGFRLFRGDKPRRAAR